MQVTRQTALEIFGLKEGTNQDEINKSFKRLSKRVHPDAGGDENLFKFILYCKEVLLSGKEEEQHQEEPQTSQTSQSTKERANIDLTTLYDIYYFLDRYKSEYDIINICGKAKMYITPCKSKKSVKTINVEVWQSFREFEQLGFASFHTRITIPETLKKFKKFKVRVEFLGKTFKFKLSMRKPYHTIKKDSGFRFNSIIEFKFE